MTISQCSSHRSSVWDSDGTCPGKKIDLSRNRREVSVLSHPCRLVSGVGTIHARHEQCGVEDATAVGRSRRRRDFVATSRMNGLPSSQQQQKRLYCWSDCGAGSASVSLSQYHTIVSVLSGLRASIMVSPSLSHRSLDAMQQRDYYYYYIQSVYVPFITLTSCDLPLLCSTLHLMVYTVHFTVPYTGTEGKACPFTDADEADNWEAINGRGISRSVILREDVDMTTLRRFCRPSKQTVSRFGLRCV